MKFPRGVMRFEQSGDGSVRVTFGGPDCGQLAMAAGFVAAGMALAVISVSRLRFAGDLPSGRKPRSDRSPT